MICVSPVHTMFVPYVLQVGSLSGALLSLLLGLGPWAHSAAVEW
jgi:hypothetical protein